MPDLILNSTPYNKEDLAKGQFGNPSTLFEKATLAFCKDWLSGRKEFQVQTSGSTGTPKTITLTRKQLEASAQMTCEALGLQPGTTSLICLNTEFIAGKMMIVRSLVTGMKMIAVEPSSNPFASLPADMTIDFTALVPYQVKKILDSPQANRLNAVHTILIGGADVEDEIAERIKSFQCTAYATFGMTETITHIALRPLDKENYFTTLPGVSIDTDDRGCLVIEVPYLAAPVATNDLVVLMGINKFRWVGRWDNVINTGGVKMSPETIERRIRHLLINKKFFVTGIRDNDLGESVALIIEGNEPKEGDTKSLTEAVRPFLRPYEVPRKIFYLRDFCYTESGKVDRKGTLALAHRQVCPASSPGGDDAES